MASDLPGRWRQDPISLIPLALGGYWGKCLPFVMESSSQFRVPPPPAMDSPEYAAALIAWLESHGRKVLNGSRALQLELSKVAQYAALRAHGIRVPRTVPAIGRDAALAAAATFEAPFIAKPNRGGKGLGVRLFHTAEALALYVEGADYESPVDGLQLLQEYVRAPKPFITRAEFIGGRFLYAVEVDTSEGFELCPADVCAVEGAFCPAGPEELDQPRAKFTIIDDIDARLKRRYEAFLAANGVAPSRRRRTAYSGSRNRKNRPVRGSLRTKKTPSAVSWRETTRSVRSLASRAGGAAGAVMGQGAREATGDPVASRHSPRRQLPCESAVLLPGWGLAPLFTSPPGLPLLSPGTPFTLSGAIRASSSSTCRLMRFMVMPRVLRLLSAGVILLSYRSRLGRR